MNNRPVLNHGFLAASRPFLPTNGDFSLMLLLVMGVVVGLDVSRVSLTGERLWSRRCRPSLVLLHSHIRNGSAAFTYAEIDPDIFGELLSSEAYRHADRIAAVWLVLRKPSM